MEVHLTRGQETFIQQKVKSGRFRSTDDALREAVCLLEERESRVLQRPFARKSLAMLFAESPFRNSDLEFPRESDTLRPVEL